MTGREALTSMGYDITTAARVRVLLAGRPDVTEKRMVGGLSFMVGDHLCCGVTSAGLMVRVGPDAYEQALTEPQVQPMAFAGRPLNGYVCVGPEGYPEDDALAEWVQRGIDFVSALPVKAAARKRSPRGTP